MRADVIGIGYEGLDAEGLLGRLHLRGVRTVVDVRLNAISRKRGLSKSRLSEMLRSAGITYEHLPALGNPRDNRDAFADQLGDAGRAARTRFDAALSSAPAEAALDLILERAADGVVALLCFEQDERVCHRELILRAIRARLAVPA